MPRASIKCECGEMIWNLEFHNALITWNNCHDGWVSVDVALPELKDSSGSEMLQLQVKPKYYPITAKRHITKAAFTNHDNSDDWYYLDPETRNVYRLGKISDYPEASWRELPELPKGESDE